MVMGSYYFFTQEWNESDILPHGRCTAKVTEYGFKTEKEINEIVYYMERYSPYDYVDHYKDKNEEAYRRQIEILRDNGAEIVEA